MKIRTRLTPAQRSIVRQIVRAERGDRFLSPGMKAIADSVAQDTLRDEYGIRVGLRKIARIA